MSVAQTPATLALGAESAPAPRKTRPVAVWAWVGAAWALLFVYVFAHWILSGNAQDYGTGVTPVPDWVQNMALAQQVVFGLGSAILGYFLVVREWRREGHLTLNGMCYICLATAWWQDSWLNFITPQMAYNSELVNFGSWNASVPLWSSPHAESASSPIVWYLGVYPLIFVGGTLLIMRGMRAVQARHPRLGKAGLTAGLFVALAFFAVIFESVFVFTDMYTYVGVGGPQLFAGTGHAFPVLVPVLDAMIWTAWTALIYFRNDKGETIVERGIDDVRMSGAAKRGLRMLALFGACQIIYILCYNGPVQLAGLHPNAWPKEIQEKSYFTNGVCGEGTDTACPGWTAFARRDAARIGPDGRVVVPDGVAPLPFVGLRRE